MGSLHYKVSPLEGHSQWVNPPFLLLSHSSHPLLSYAPMLYHYLHSTVAHRDLSVQHPHPTPPLAQGWSCAPVCPCASGSWWHTCPWPACPWHSGTCYGATAGTHKKNVNTNNITSTTEFGQGFHRYTTSQQKLSQAGNWGPEPKTSASAKQLPMLSYFRSVVAATAEQTSTASPVTGTP